MAKTPLKFIDLFAGIGGFRMAFQSQGYECVFSSEISKACQEVYSKNFGYMPQGDIAKISPKSIPDFNVLLAGFPCQPFSISGKKMGFKDTRGTLFFNICKIIKIKKPEYVVLENVKHLLHHDGGKTIQVIQNSLEELGYKSNFKILNAKDFGVPQNRERIVIIASKSGYFNFQSLRHSKPTNLRDFLDEGVSGFLDDTEYTILEEFNMQDSGLIFAGYRNKNIWKKGIRPNTKHLSRVHRQPNRIYSIDGVHPTIPSQETSGRFFIFIPEERKVRKLTINECYRIMGFPASFKKTANLSDAYRQIGNSVCVPMFAEVACQMKNPENFLKHEPQRNPHKILQLGLFD